MTEPITNQQEQQRQKLKAMLGPAALLLMAVVYLCSMLWLSVGDHIYVSYLRCTSRSERVERLVTLQQRYNSMDRVWSKTIDRIVSRRREIEKKLEENPDSRELLLEQISIESDDQENSNFYSSQMSPLKREIDLLRKSLR